ncbi:MAG TPA: SAM-dependent methyltransferase [Micromonosporaceae bacterium]|nr:SAM-dependent methyltransferase [Micromonosporaceae bacterium]
MAVTWREAMTAALYGPDGFFISGEGPAAHFRTSTHASPIFGAALLGVLTWVDNVLGHPDRLDVVDVGAGRGELLSLLARTAPPPLRHRLQLTCVELAPRPDSLPASIEWRNQLPSKVTGLLLATEWLDNVPVEVAEAGPDKWRYVMVDAANGSESFGPPVVGADARWLHEWWPKTPGGRAEVGRYRDVAWAEAVAAIDRGLALTVDYGHLRKDRPYAGTVTGFRAGRQVPPVPDGSCDLTAHVTMDSAAAAGSAVADRPYLLIRQREALQALGADGARPPLTLASTDPARYLRALSAASAAAELIDPTGLGAHWWLLQPVGIDAVGSIGEIVGRDPGTGVP